MVGAAMIMWPDPDQLYAVRVCGIPALAGFDGSETGIAVHDRRGRPAPWLKSKLDDDEIETFSVRQRLFEAERQARRDYLQSLTK